MSQEQAPLLQKEDLEQQVIYEPLGNTMFPPAVTGSVTFFSKLCSLDDALVLLERFYQFRSSPNYTMKLGV